MLYIFSVLFMSSMAAATIKCSDQDKYSMVTRSCISESNSHQIENVKSPVVHELLSSVCAKSKYTDVPRVQRSSAGSGLTNLFYMMALPVGVHTRSEN